MICSQSCRTKLESSSQFVTAPKSNSEGGVTFASKHIYKKNQEYLTYEHVAGTTKTLLRKTGKGRLSISAGIHPAVRILGSIIRYTRNDVKRQEYLPTTGRFHEQFGKGWRKKRWRRTRDSSRRNISSSSLTSKQ